MNTHLFPKTSSLLFSQKSKIYSAAGLRTLDFETKGGNGNRCGNKSKKRFALSCLVRKFFEVNMQRFLIFFWPSSKNRICLCGLRVTFGTLALSACVIFLRQKRNRTDDKVYMHYVTARSLHKTNTYYFDRYSTVYICQIV